jgi:hypothetical protein
MMCLRLCRTIALLAFFPAAGFAQPADGSYYSRNTALLGYWKATSPRMHEFPAPSTCRDCAEIEYRPTDTNVKDTVPHDDVNQDMFREWVDASTSPPTPYIFSPNEGLTVLKVSSGYDGGYSNRCGWQAGCGSGKTGWLSCA